MNGKVNQNQMRIIAICIDIADVNVNNSDLNIVASPSNAFNFKHLNAEKERLCRYEITKQAKYW